MPPWPSCAVFVLIAARSVRSKPLQISILEKLTRIRRALLPAVVDLVVVIVVVVSHIVRMIGSEHADDNEQIRMA